MTRRALVLPLLALHCLADAQAAARPLAEPGPVAPWVAGAVQAGGLAIGTQPEQTPPGHDTWASWTTGDPDRWRVHLVLLRRTGRTVRVVWSTIRRDGYSPTLQDPRWDADGHPILMLQFQYGAAYTRAEFYAVGRSGHPVMLDSVEGSWIERDRTGVSDRLKAYDTADLQGAPRCFGWDAQARKLARLDC